LSVINSDQHPCGLKASTTSWDRKSEPLARQSPI
jgi:hypothetical protein